MQNGTDMSATSPTMSSVGETKMDAPNSLEPQTSSSDVSTNSKALQDGLSQTLEERLRKLEEQIAEMKKVIPERQPEDTKSDDGEQEKKSDDETKRLKSTSQARFLTVDEYDKRDFSFEKEHYAIDVMTSSNWRLTNTCVESISPQDIIDSKPRSDPRPAHRDLASLSFVQINSRALIEVLKNTTDDRDTEWPTNACVILAPFKSLRYQEHSLRQLLTQLHRTWSPVTVETQDTPSAPSDRLEGIDANPAEDDTAKAHSVSQVVTETDKVDVQPQTKATGLDDDTAYNGLKAYQDLICLMSFYDQFVKPWWDHLRALDVKSVHFGDLCALYRPGDLVVMPDDPQRVYRVIKITGARPTIKHLYQGKSAQSSEDSEETGDAKGGKEVKLQQKSASGSDESKDWTTLKLDCYYLDYDGTAFATVHKLWRIKYFSGSRDVKQLRPYPMRYAPSKTRQEYLETGIEFLNMAGNPPSLHSYDGRTLAQLPSGSKMNRNGDPSDDDRNSKSMVSPEDVDAQVVIDFDSTFMVRYIGTARAISKVPRLTHCSITRSGHQKPGSPTSLATIIARITKRTYRRSLLSALPKSRSNVSTFLTPRRPTDTAKTIQ